MKGHWPKFTRKMEVAIAALLTRHNLDEAARVAAIGATTVLRWPNPPELQEGYREGRRHAHGQAIARLQEASGTATSGPVKVMLDSNTPPATRVRAADTVLSHSTRSIELDDLYLRLAELERLAIETKAPGGTR